jgi:hypothetical protein
MSYAGDYFFLTDRHPKCLGCTLETTQKSHPEAAASWPEYSVNGAV